MSTRYPYPGLRPFDRQESDIFFGREEQTDELLRRLSRRRLLAVVGVSGCGKSSLVRAGLLSGLEAGYMADTGVEWRIAALRPGSTPIARLADALLEQRALGRELGDADKARPFIEAVLRKGPLGMIEVWQETGLTDRTNLLVLVDQFEEIFRFQSAAQKDEADAFVGLLLAAAAQREAPLFIVFTMRSDYLGQCAVFSGLPEALNEAQYLCPKLSREQQQAAIAGPARVFGGRAAPELISYLLNSMAAKPRQLPVLQHLLMRMWTHKTSETDGRMLQPDEASPVLTLDDCTEVGGLEDALSRHADEAYASLPVSLQQVAERVFRRLCDQGRGHEDIRSPASIKTLSRVAGAAIEEVKQVVETFRDPSYSFLTPAPPVLLDEETVVDISHESLIRGWRRLAEWTRAEAASAEQYRFLEDAAGRWAHGKAALWGSPDLDIALSWKQREKPTPDWAIRYGGDFETAENFLAESQKQQHRRLYRRHLRLTAAVIALIGAVLLLGARSGMKWYLHEQPYDAYFAGFIKRRGAPEGIRPLTSEQVARRNQSFLITREGRLGPVIRIQSVNGSGELTTKHSVSTYVSRHSTKRECDWRYFYDANGRVVSEHAHDGWGNPVWGFTYLMSDSLDKNHAKGLYVGPNGYPKPPAGAKAASIDFEYDPKTGFDFIQHYRNRNGHPSLGPDKQFGLRFKYDPNGLLLEVASLNEEGRPMNDEMGNAFARYGYDKNGNVITGKAFNASGNPTTINQGWFERRTLWDENYRATQLSFWGTDGRPTLTDDLFHRVTIKYDEQGNVIEWTFFGTDGTPVLNKAGVHIGRAEYKEDDSSVEVWQRFYDAADNPVTNVRGCAQLQKTYDKMEHLTREACLDVSGNFAPYTDGFAATEYAYDKMGNLLSSTHLGTDKKPTMGNEGYASKRNRYDKQGNLVSISYFDAENRPVLNKRGCGQELGTYDADGFLTQEMLMGLDGKPIIGNEGWAEKQYEYDSFGYERRVSFYDTQENPMTIRGGYAGYTREFDSLGNEIRREYFGETGSVVTVTQGYASWTSSYDKAGRVIRTRYFDLDRRPAIISAGYAGISYKYDGRGNVLETAFLDVDGSPIVCNEGYAVIRKKYDSRDNEIEERRYGLNGEPLRCPEAKQVAVVTSRYDEKRRLVERKYFDGDNAPAAHRCIPGGRHRTEFQYDERGRVVEELHFDAYNVPVLGVEEQDEIKESTRQKVASFLE